MRSKFILVRHVVSAAIALCVLLGLLYFSFPWSSRVLNEPQAYLRTDLSPVEFQSNTIYLLLITICVLVSYITYLLLLSRGRYEFMTLVTTRSLRSSLEELEKLYEEAPVPYVLLNQKGEIGKPNKAALRFFGAAAGELEGRNIFDFLSGKGGEKLEKLTRRYQAGIPIDREELEFAVGQSGSKWALLSVFELKSRSGGEHSGLASIFDITQEKKLDQAKTEFVSLASHQLRTPTATVKWYSEMLLSGDLGSLEPKQREYLETIGKVNQSMIELVDTLLNVSRLEIGSIKPEFKPSDAIDITESVLLELSNQIEEKGLKVVKQFDGSFRDIKSDAKLLRIVIQNLLSNAVKYTPQGGSVEIVFKDSLMEKSILVSDTGVGIPEGEQDKVSSKMFRASNVRRLQEVSGTGLGLYLVKSIMEALGGSLSFSSEENKGSTFIIKF